MTSATKLASQGIPFPAAATLVDFSEFKSTTIRKDDTFTQRVVMDINGVNVQIIRHDHDNSAVTVFVGTRCQIMPMSRVSDYIERRTIRR
jgi:hypothetical protein